jgi:hypothetical protein
VGLWHHVACNVAFSRYQNELCCVKYICFSRPLMAGGSHIMVLDEWTQRYIQASFRQALIGQYIVE